VREERTLVNLNLHEPSTVATYTTRGLSIHPALAQSTSTGSVVLAVVAVFLLADASSAMITPLFSVTQDELSVTVTMRTPYIRADELEIDVAGNTFKCYLRPYYLSLTFKQLLQEGGEKVFSWDNIYIYMHSTFSHTGIIHIMHIYIYIMR
jgi:hypothetical protein